MKRLDIIRPEDSELVSVFQNVDCASGSKAINDEFHDMFVSVNGRLEGPYGADTYTLDPGYSPFFTRIRTYPTGGKAPINVTVFYVSKNVHTLQWGTGEITCSEKVLDVPVPVRVAAGGTLIFRVEDSRLFLTNLVGLRGFDSEDAGRSSRAMIVPMIRDAIVERMKSESFTAAQADVSAISSSVLSLLTVPLGNYGLFPDQFSINCININPEDLDLLRKIHEKRVDRATDIEALKK